MPEGTVEFFNESGGHGFIGTDATDDDVFFHLQDPDVPDDPLSEGTPVTFRVEHAEKGPRAVDLVRGTGGASGAGAGASASTSNDSSSASASTASSSSPGGSSATDTQVYDGGDRDDTEVFDADSDDGASYCTSCGADLAGKGDANYCPQCGSGM